MADSQRSGEKPICLVDCHLLFKLSIYLNLFKTGLTDARLNVQKVVQLSANSLVCNRKK